MKTGDVVQLKSGGPVMTVLKVAEFSRLGLRTECHWFGPSGEPKKEYFHPDMLKVTEPPGA